MHSRRRLNRPQLTRAVRVSIESLEQRIQMDAAYKAISAGPLFQNWTNINLITSDDDWSGVPSIQGFRGDSLASGTGADPQTVVTTSTIIDVNANHGEDPPDKFTSGGVTEFDHSPGIDPVVALKGTATAKAPYLQFNVDTTGVSQVEVKYTLRDIGGAATTKNALQYRLGETGNWTNVPAGFVTDTAAGGGVHNVDAILPANAAGQPKVQIRSITTDAAGSDKWIGVDDIYVGDGSPVPQQVQFNTTNFSTAENGGSITIGVNRIGDLSGAASVNYATSNGTAASPGDYTAASGTINFASGQANASFTVSITDDQINEPTETFNVTLSSPSAGLSLGTPATSTVTITDDDAAAPTGILLNEVVADPSGTDNGFEYLELKGTPGQSLTNVYVCSVEGDSGAGIGNVDVVFNLTGQVLGSNGLLIIKAASNTAFTPDAGTTVVTDVGLNNAPIENGSNSFLVIFSPSTITTGTDLDPSDFGNLALPAGASLLDGIGWRDFDNGGDRAFGAELIMPSLTTDPDAATRIPGNTTANSADAWYYGALLDSNVSNERLYDTGNASANIPRQAMITPGNPNFAGDGSTIGEIGFATFNYSVNEPDGTATITVLRTAGSTGSVSVSYAATANTATANTDFTPVSGVLTFGDGETSKTFTIPILDDAVAENVETVNLTLTSPTGGAVVGPRPTSTLSINDNDTVVLLNEVSPNPPGSDGSGEYLELKSTPGILLGNVYVVSVEGDISPANDGLVTAVFNLNGKTVGSNGLILIKSSLNTLTADPATTVINDAAFDTGALQNGTNSFLVILSPTAITTSTDLDTNDDGVLDLPAGAVVQDGFGFQNVGVGGLIYAPQLALPVSVTNFAATRIVGNDTPNSASAWYYGALTGTDNTAINYDPTKSSANLPAGAKLTPGAPNFVASADTTPPTVTGSFDFDAAHQRITLSFSEPVPNFDASDITITQTVPAGSGDVPAANIVLTPTTGNNYEVTFVNYPNNALPDGRYHFVIHAAGVADAANNPLANDFTLDVFALTADANRDSRVNALDFNALANHYGQAGTFSQGDFNYDGTVNVQDFTLLSQRFNKTLAASAPAAPLRSLFSDKPVTDDALAGIL